MVTQGKHRRTALSITSLLLVLVGSVLAVQIRLAAQPIRSPEAIGAVPLSGEGRVLSFEPHPRESTYFIFLIGPEYQQFSEDIDVKVESRTPLIEMTPNVRRTASGLQIAEAHFSQPGPDRIAFRIAVYLASEDEDVEVGVRGLLGGFEYEWLRLAAIYALPVTVALALGGFWCLYRISRPRTA